MHELNPSSAPRPELAGSKSDFEYSTERCLAVLDEYAHKNVVLYYHPVWEDSCNKIAEIKLMNLTPTGALRQEYRGNFYRAQFRLREWSDTDKAVNKGFLWCNASTTLTSSRRSPDPEALQAESGYVRLTPENMFATLVEHSESVGDHVVLLRALDERGIQGSRLLIKSLSPHAYRMVESGLDERTLPFEAPEYREIFYNFLHYLSKISPTHGVNLQGRLVSKLMRASDVPVGHFDIPSDERRVQNVAVQTLEEALTRGVLSKEPRIVDRLLLYAPLYQTPSITEFVYDQLHSERYKEANRNVFSIKRDAFAYDFMMATLDGLVRSGKVEDAELEKHIKQTLYRVHRAIYRKPPISFMPIHRLAHKAVGMPMPSKVLGEVARPSIEATTAASIAFLSILEAARGEDPETAVAQHMLNLKSAEIVDIVLRPLVRRKLGNTAMNLDEPIPDA